MPIVIAQTRNVRLIIESLASGGDHKRATGFVTERLIKGRWHHARFDSSLSEAYKTFSIEAY